MCVCDQMRKKMKGKVKVKEGGEKEEEQAEEEKLNILLRLLCSSEAPGKLKRALKIKQQH